MDTPHIKETIKITVYTAILRLAVIEKSQTSPGIRNKGLP